MLSSPLYSPRCVLVTLGSKNAQSLSASVDARTEHFISSYLVFSSGHPNQFLAGDVYAWTCVEEVCHGLLHSYTRQRDGYPTLTCTCRAVALPEPITCAPHAETPYSLQSLRSIGEGFLLRRCSAIGFSEAALSRLAMPFEPRPPPLAPWLIRSGLAKDERPPERLSSVFQNGSQASIA